MRLTFTVTLFGILKIPRHLLWWANGKVKTKCCSYGQLNAKIENQGREFIVFSSLNRGGFIMGKLSVPCVRFMQNGRRLFMFVVDGKVIPTFATVPHVGHGEKGELSGFQRPEVKAHINNIREYLESG